MKKEILGLLILLWGISLSCTKKEQETKYYWVTLKDDKINQISRFDRQEKKDTSILSYYAQWDTLNYYILHKNRDSSFTVSSYQDGLLLPIMDTTLILNGNELMVTKYVQNKGILDGEVIHYYSPQLGIFAVHSNTWPGLQYLQSNDTDQNKLVKDLIKATVPNFFIKGKLKAELEKY
ncbi:hypothetical protein [Pontibacter russatus]|uniref:hypothetical protein n=1 Tax=Pontibacter russatus TaxID=2694929 RepID=UPI001379A994|nr:hypothetical protein [Pontibacter russatus]